LKIEYYEPKVLKLRQKMKTN